MYFGNYTVINLLYRKAQDTRKRYAFLSLMTREIYEKWRCLANWLFKGHHISVFYTFSLAVEDSSRISSYLPHPSRLSNPCYFRISSPCKRHSICCLHQHHLKSCLYSFLLFSIIDGVCAGIYIITSSKNRDETDRWSHKNQILAAVRWSLMI